MMAKDQIPEKETSKKSEDASTQPIVIEGKHGTQSDGNKTSRLTRFKIWYVSNKKRSIPLTVVFVLLVIFAIPLSRYSILGLVIKKNYQVTVLDAETNKPVSEADIALAGQSAKTDKEGRATLKVKLGKSTLSLSKKYYENTQEKVTVNLGTKNNQKEVKLRATGRQVPVQVSNKITGQPLEDAIINVADTTARTDKSGQVTLVLPPEKQTIDAVIKHAGYNDQTVSVKVVSDVLKENSFNLTPTGKLYFLSKLSGKIDVVKTNLDGTERQTVLGGTGFEDEGDTVLLASRDWKYLALHSKRDKGLAKLYLIETDGDRLNTIDEGNASFALSGWLNDSFIYTVYRSNIPSWQNKASSLKSFNALSKKITILDDSRAVGDSESYYLKSSINNVSLLNDNVIWTNSWTEYSFYAGVLFNEKTDDIISSKPDGKDKKILKSFPRSDNAFIRGVLYKPNEIYFLQRSFTNKSSFYEYEDGQLKNANDVTDEQFNKPYPTFLISPSGKMSSWYESRDGKNTLFIGDADGNNEKQLAALTDYVPYGWYSDDYILFSKNNSELYISSVKNFDINKIIKITDYHKPQINFRGYGGGYGGF